MIFSIEANATETEFRVIEFTKNGFHVLGAYDDREIAEDRMAQWKKEAGFRGSPTREKFPMSMNKETSSIANATISISADLSEFLKQMRKLVGTLEEIVETKDDNWKVGSPEYAAWVNALTEKEMKDSGKMGENSTESINEPIAEKPKSAKAEYASDPFVKRPGATFTPPYPEIPRIFINYNPSHIGFTAVWTAQFATKDSRVTSAFSGQTPEEAIGKLVMACHKELGINVNPVAGIGIKP